MCWNWVYSGNCNDWNCSREHPPAAWGATSRQGGGGGRQQVSWEKPKQESWGDWKWEERPAWKKPKPAESLTLSLSLSLTLSLTLSLSLTLNLTLTLKPLDR